MQLKEAIKSLGDFSVLVKLHPEVTATIKIMVEQEVVEVVKKEQPPLIGISFLFSGTFPLARQYAQLIKEIAPNSKIITGGIHATSYPREMFENLTLDQINWKRISVYMIIFLYIMAKALQEIFLIN